MYTRGHEGARVLQEQFVEAVRESIRQHCVGVLKHVPSEELDGLALEDVILMLTQYVVNDVMELGSQFLCWKLVVDTVEKSVSGILKLARRRMDGEAEEGISTA